jgi:hypothetical protein
MNILFFFSEMLSEQFVITGLELILRHKKKGDSIHIITCDGKVKTCYSNKHHRPSLCMLCKLRLKKNLEKLGLSSHNVSFLKKDSFFEKKQFKTIDELKQFVWKDVNIGMPVASRLISELRDHQPDTIQHQNYINNLIESSQTAYYSLKKYLEKKKPNLFYIYNGRADVNGAALLAAEKTNTPFITYDSSRATNPFKYTLFYQASICNLNALKINMAKLWDKQTELDKETASIKWFERKKERHNAVGPSVIFTKKQSFGLLPQNFDKKKRNITIFNSSIDEVAAVEGWGTLFNQDEAYTIKEIVSFFNENKNMHFYLRIHPNLSKQNNTQTEALKKLEAKKHSNLTIIAPTSSVDSYELMLASNKIITFGSTTGVEATFWGKPSILLGKAIYENLECCYIPETFSELYKLIAKPLKAKEKSKALPYGWWATHYAKNTIKMLTNYSPTLKYEYSNKEKFKLRLIDTLNKIGF